MKNMLLEKPDYKIEKTRYGTWRRHLSVSGLYFAEFTSHRVLFGLPLFHYTRGICPETGRRIIAKGIVAVGRIAAGGIAIGQASFGLIAVGQLAAGILFGLGQGCSGMFALGQLAIGFILGIGQISTGIVAIGQIAIGKYVLAQTGLGQHIWTQKVTDPQAVRFFKTFLSWLRP
ncbi:hypothetical protein [Desulfonema magnum]|uniref:Uncharacterized protein n=1 Tax=Desulfonema magnum TaxID=45655 RepID=A0A975GPS1_9BACT|nr:hypothetical protein [Desulfonema magnum]QTA89306.1 Uncharacterized protein dnm_053560 [Desulfonema magnum]